MLHICKLTKFNYEITGKRFWVERWRFVLGVRSRYLFIVALLLIHMCALFYLLLLLLGAFVVPTALCFAVDLSRVLRRTFVDAVVVFRKRIDGVFITTTTRNVFSANKKRRWGKHK